MVGDARGFRENKAGEEESLIGDGDCSTNEGARRHPRQKTVISKDSQEEA
jgi:hypothetical protein